MLILYIIISIAHEITHGPMLHRYQYYYSRSTVRTEATIMRRMYRCHKDYGFSDIVYNSVFPSASPSPVSTLNCHKLAAICISHA